MTRSDKIKAEDFQYLRKGIQQEFFSMVLSVRYVWTLEQVSLSCSNTLFKEVKDYYCTEHNLQPYLVLTIALVVLCF